LLVWWIILIIYVISSAGQWILRLWSVRSKMWLHTKLAILVSFIWFLGTRNMRAWARLMKPDGVAIREKRNCRRWRMRQGLTCIRVGFWITNNHHSIHNYRCCETKLHNSRAKNAGVFPSGLCRVWVNSGFLSDNSFRQNVQSLDRALWSECNTREADCGFWSECRDPEVQADHLKSEIEEAE
jgi:hypothetical protein